MRDLASKNNVLLIYYHISISNRNHTSNGRNKNTCHIACLIKIGATQKMLSAIYSPPSIIKSYKVDWIRYYHWN